MNKLSQVALAAVACCITGLAQADTTYSAGFSLEDRWLPALHTGSQNWDGPNSLPGAWTSLSNVNAVANSRDLLSSSVDPVTGTVENTWGFQNHSENRHRSGAPLLAIGESYATIPGPSPWSHTVADVSIGWHSMNASITLTDRYANADARATWSRDFSLDAHSSFTFSGLATLGVTGDTNPLAAGTTFNSNASFASLTLGDLFGRVSTTIGANIWGAASGLGNIFSYSVGPGGLLALTITNSGDSALSGTLSAGSYVAVSAPVPEPETWLLLLAGAGIVGFTARKRRPVGALAAQA